MEKIIKPILYGIAAILVFQFLSSIVVKKFDYFKNKQSDVSIITASERERQLECLARNIYHEAGSEPFESKVAVAQVTINRSESGMFPSDICKVIYQKNKFMEKVVCQFSWYCDNPSKMKLLSSDVYDESYKVAKKVLLEGFRLPGLTEALYYHADYVNPGWKKERVAKIGRHIFYKA
ncbi:cell wall hydrolase [bacterium]|nr:cell wall hydrolase [bacterium]